jgi:hypothetical protein
VEQLSSCQPSWELCDGSLMEEKATWSTFFSNSFVPKSTKIEGDKDLLTADTYENLHEFWVITREGTLYIKI